jgi:pimeloyl-ACP methyl ester carboxylesterase
MEARTIDLGAGRSLHAVQAGTGPDIVLVHGALATSHDWTSGPFEAFATLGRVTAVDRPGHGLSLRPRFDGTPRSQARQIKDGLDALGVGRALLVGHSFGALVSLAFAELFADEVAHLVLVGPLAFPEPRLIEHSLLAPRATPVLGPLLSSAAEATFDPAFLRLLQQMMFWPDPVPELWRETFPYDQVLDRAAMVAEGEDMAAILPGSLPGMINLAAVPVPATILIGTSDKILDHNRQGRLLAPLMPRAKLVELMGIGHMPHHAAPDALLAAVRDALALA